MKHRILFILLLLNTSVYAEGLLTSNNEDNSGIEDLSQIETMDRTNQPMIIKSLNSTQAFFDDSRPQDNTLLVQYNPLAIIKIRVREFMGTLISLPDGDFIKHYKVNDSENFSFSPSTDPTSDEYPTTGQVDTTLAGADTSLHIIGTSGNIYTFYLRSDSWESKYAPTLKVLIKDDNLINKLNIDKRRKKILKDKEKAALMLAESEQEKKHQKTAKNNEYLQHVPFDPMSLDFGYKIMGGDEDIRPFMVYDDGKFTYFRFSKKNNVADISNLPTVYRVADGSDVPSNVSPMKGTLRVEGVVNKWTLRLGDKYLCIERTSFIPNKESSMNTFKPAEKKSELSANEERLKRRSK